MIDCPNGEIRDVLPDYLHERLEPRSRAAVTEHLSVCAACSAELALLEMVRRTAARAPAVDVSAVLGRLPAPRRAAPASVRRLSGRSQWQRPMIGVAAVLLIAATALLAERQLGPDHPSASPSAMAGSGVSSDAEAGRPTVPELAFAGGLSDLSVSALEELLDELESLEALPVEEPQPILLPVSQARAGEG